jgi:thymidylate synthase (FAD)
MKISVLDKTSGREKTPVVAARGDYMSDWNGEQNFTEIMESVNFSDDDLSSVKENDHYPELSDEREAKLKSFVEKQLSRGHYGPWEQSYITFAVKGVSRVTMAQVTRHRHMTFDVQSQRYVDFSDVNIITPRSLEDADHFSRETGELAYGDKHRKKFKKSYEQHVADAIDEYQSMVDAGVPKEDARFVLPLGTPVNMTFSGNARTFLHLLNLRDKASAQWEIRELSNKLIDKLMDWMPYTYSWYSENKPHKIGP